jgi:hypothetical protein
MVILSCVTFLPDEQYVYKLGQGDWHAGHATQARPSQVR